MGLASPRATPVEGVLGSFGTAFTGEVWLRVLTNGLVGIASGWAYWRGGLESAIIVSAPAGIVFNVIGSALG